MEKHNFFCKKNFICRNNLIIFIRDFNEPLNNYIEIINNHDTIFFGRLFNKDISILPPNITCIIFSSDSEFNQEIKDFPFNLKKIFFGNKFNKNLEYLPNSLEELEFYSFSEFNNDLSNLPTSIKKITLGKNYSKELNNLPSNIEYLKLCSNYKHNIKVFPVKLKYLNFYEYDKDDNIYNDFYRKQSSSTSYEHYSYNTNNILHINFNISNLPDGIIEIVYPKNYLFPIENLPNSLKIIKINFNYKFIEKLKNDYPHIIFLNKS